MKTSVAVLLPFIALFSAMLPAVSAHGFVNKFTVDGKLYKGNTPNGKANASPIRLINSINPVKGATNKNVMCGPSAQPASLVADVNPGSKISFSWATPSGKWPHNTGPLMTYMASCGSTTCDKFDASQAKWFKIDEAGRKSNGDWFQQDIMDGKEYSTSVPQNLKAGGYLIRHEIIALHLANNKGGAEFYPSCIQVNVKGSGTGTPSSNSLVSFPGAYSDSDAGIFDKNVFNTKAKYSFPGPAVVQLAAGGSSSTPADDGDDSDSEPVSSSSVKPSGTKSTPVPSSTGKTNNNNSKACGSEKKKRMIVKRAATLPSIAEPVVDVIEPEVNIAEPENNSTDTTEDAITKPHPAVEAHPRHLSRVMGRLTHINNQW